MTSRRSRGSRHEVHRRHSVPSGYVPAVEYTTIAAKAAGESAWHRPCSCLRAVPRPARLAARELRRHRGLVLADERRVLLIHPYRYPGPVLEQRYGHRRQPFADGRARGLLPLRRLLAPSPWGATVVVTDLSRGRRSDGERDRHDRRRHPSAHLDLRRCAGCFGHPGYTEHFAYRWLTTAPPGPLQVGSLCG